MRQSRTLLRVFIRKRERRTWRRCRLPKHTGRNEMNTQHVEIHSAISCCIPPISLLHRKQSQLASAFCMMLFGTGKSPVWHHDHLRKLSAPVFRVFSRSVKSASRADSVKLTAEGVKPRSRRVREKSERAKVFLHITDPL